MWSPLGPAPGAPPAEDAAAGAARAVPPPMPPAGGGVRKAFICGISYLGSRSQLNGCANDAKCMAYMLQSRFGFREDQILMFLDDHPDPARRPTRANMLLGFTWLTTSLKAGDSLVFHYSGHGGQARDPHGDEADGFNETLLPLDFERAGPLHDDELNARLVNPLPAGTKLHAIIDACHSGSVLDMEHQAQVAPDGRVYWRPAYTRPPRFNKGTAGGFCVQLSASADHQTAADTTKLSGNVATGAATFAFIKAIEANAGAAGLAYGELLLCMHRTLSAAGLGAPPGGGAGRAPQYGMGGAGPMEALLLGLLGGGGGGFGGGGGGFRGQDIVMSANRPFDLAAPFEL